MTKIRIKYQFCKKITTLCGSARTILWDLQRNMSGIIRVNSIICPENRKRLPSYIAKIKALTIDVLEKEEKKGSSKVAKKTSKKVFDHIFYGDPLKGVSEKFSLMDLTKNIDTASSLLQHLLKEGYIKEKEEDQGIYKKTEKLSSLRGKVIYKFSEASAKLLRTKQFFEIDLEAYSKLRSQKTKLFYELLCQFRSTQKIGQFGQNFKKSLGLSHKRYPSAKSFEDTELLPIIKEIEEKTNFRLNRNKDGSVNVGIGKFVYFCFTEIPKETAVETLQYQTLYERLLEKGVPAREASKAIRLLGEKYINRLAYTVALDKSDGKIESKLKVLMSKIRQALALLETNVEKKKKRIEAFKKAKKTQFSKREVEKNKLSKKKISKKTSPPLHHEKINPYKKPSHAAGFSPGIVYFKENKGTQSLSEIMSSMQKTNQLTNQNPKIMMNKKLYN